MAPDRADEPVLESTDQGSPNVQVRAYRVTGRVQGVGFRWFTRGVADELGLSGAVQNYHDGSVRVHAKGALTMLDQLEAMLARGPVAARVEAVERVEPSQGSTTDGFRIERTR